MLVKLSVGYVLSLRAPDNRCEYTRVRLQESMDTIRRFIAWLLDVMFSIVMGGASGVLHPVVIEPVPPLPPLELPPPLSLTVGRRISISRMPSIWESMRAESSVPSVSLRRLASAKTASSTLRRAWNEMSEGTPVDELPPVDEPPPIPGGGGGAPENNASKIALASRLGGRKLLGPRWAMLLPVVPMAVSPVKAIMPVSYDL